MSGLDRFINSRTTRTVGGIVNNRIGDAVRGISDPTLRNGASQILDAISPGLGGGTPDFQDFKTNNTFRDIYIDSLREQAEVITRPLQDASDTSSLANSYDWRARLRPKRGGEEKFYAEGEPLGLPEAMMAPIQESGGLVWKNMPSVFMSAMASYSEAGQQGQGTNYPIRTFQHSTVQPIPVQADFTANDIYEARYLLAVFTFLKIATKAYFGDQAVRGGNYGTPPPVLLFEYLGDHGFNKVPVVIESYTYNLQNDVDYVPVEVQAPGNGNGSTVTYVPSIVNISLTLQPQYTPHKLRRVFDLDRLANGIGYKDGFI